MFLPSLPIPSSPTWLLSLDFDETLFDRVSADKIPPDFFSLMREWRTRYNVLWGINTGRTIDYLWQDYSTIPHASFSPDFIITMERHIHISDIHGNLAEITSWNIPCAMAHEELYVTHKHVFDRLFSRLEHEHAQLNWQRQEGDPYSIIVEHPDHLDHMAPTIDDVISPHPEIGIQRAGPYLRFCLAHYNKGTALREIAQQFSIHDDKIIIIGDGHNDMDAMKENPLAICMSPGNGETPLHNLVRSRSGYISPLPCNQGVLDALHTFILPRLIHK